MKNYLIYYLFITLSIFLNSCTEGFKEEYSKLVIALTEVTAITTPTTDTTPDYTFSSTGSGAITYGGSCSSSTTIATIGNNTITLSSLSVGTYADCTITVSKTIFTENSEKKLSGSLTITSFTVSSSNDTTAPTVSSVSTTADNQSSVSVTDNITVTFSEAMDTSYVTTSTSDTNCAGTIRVSSDNFSSCVKMSSEPASSNSNNTFTLDPYYNLTVSTTYKTRVTTGVKDTAGNALSSQYETSSGFTTLSPTVLYETTTSTRSGNNIVYSQNNSTSYSDSDLQADGARIGYRMEVTNNGTDYYAETIFDAWDGITLSSLLFPTVPNENVIQRTVTNMSVASNYPTVTNTSSTSGRLEIWPWNYSQGAQNNIGGDNSKYDFDDTHVGRR